jgi:PhzF family phenazine biosynthesis protein
MKFFQVDAFTKNYRGGNPAGVVFQAEFLTDSQMQSLASRAAFSETAFILESQTADHRLRFFTPRQEVGICAHATMAAYHLMLEQGVLQPGVYKMETLAGLQRVRLAPDGVCSMTQNLPQFGMKVAPEILAPALGLLPAEVSDQIPIRVVSTGLKKIFVPIANLEILNRIKFDFKAIDRISRDHDAIGVYVFSLETVGNSTAHCRNCAPTVGIEEDSATGTSAAALASNLFEYGILEDIGDAYHSFEQGYCIAQPSEILVQLITKKAIIEEVWVAGRSVTIHEMEFSEPG